MSKAYIYLFDDIDSLSVDFVSENRNRLPVFRQQQCARYRQEFDKNACVLAYLLLDKGLREQFNIAPPFEFIYNEHGKPYLRDFPHIFFNISHCKYGVVCTLADFEVGIDIQEVRPFDVDIARRVCSENELQQLSETDNPSRLFCKMWTKKESYAKAKGISAAGVLKRDLPDKDFFIQEYENYYISLFGVNDVEIIAIKLPL